MATSGKPQMPRPVTGARIDSAMEAIPNLLLRLSGADYAYGTAAAIAAAVLVISVTLHLRQQRKREVNDLDLDAFREKRQLLLYCGDVKALTDLAIQRHMSDVTFLQRLREQPCYDTLLTHFSSAFHERLDQKLKHDGHGDLAAACRKECERLEQLWQAG